MIYYVYALRDPETLAVHYIGQTYDPLRRLGNHQQPSMQSIAMKVWVDGLKERGLSPMLEILEMCSMEEAGAIENRTIGEHLRQGAPLINKNYGGWGSSPYAKANYAPPAVASSLLPPPPKRSPMPTPTPRLIWGARPLALKCQREGCGREPLCGFSDAEGAVFFCAVCLDDSDGERPPRFRTAAERERIMRYAGKP